MKPEDTIPATKSATEIDEGAIEALEAVAETRRRLAEVPASVVVANHAMGLFELAAIHLSAEPVRLADAQIAIDVSAFSTHGNGRFIRLEGAHSGLDDVN